MSLGVELCSHLSLIIHQKNVTFTSVFEELMLFCVNCLSLQRNFFINVTSTHILLVFKHDRYFFV